MVYPRNKVQNKEKLKRVLKPVLILVVVLAALCAVFFMYVGDYYRADETAQGVLDTDSSIETIGQYTILSPSNPSDTALIFYPGAKVEASAYLPILEKIKQNGVTCVLVTMPYNMAIFDKDAADGVYELLPDVKNWYIGGHSMGGAMASSYASDNQDKVSGLILLGAYVYGDYPLDKALTIYGSLNTGVAKKINYTDNVVVIDGGNHAQFGNYGKQKGDADAAISSEQQQDIAVEAIKDFMERNEQ